MSVIEAEGIKKSFVTGDVTLNVLKGVDFKLEEGEFVAIVGKVTLLGKDLSTVSDDQLAAMRRKDFSFVYQFDNLVQNLTVYENVTLPLALDKRKESDYKDSAMDIISYLGLAERANNYPRQLSGGEQQRAAIARALVTSPKVIFLDEPTGSLDKERGRQVMELLADINKNRGVALVMVTHSPAHAKYASRIVAMEDGALLKEQE